MKESVGAALASVECGAFIAQALSQSIGEGQDDRTIQGDELLQRRDRHGTAGAMCTRIREIVKAQNVVHVLAVAQRVRRCLPSLKNATDSPPSVLSSVPVALDTPAPATKGGRLGPLTNNGGPTLPHSLLTGSPASEQLSNTSQATNQRGDPLARHADVGAYELQEYGLFVIDLTTNPEEGSDATVSIRRIGGFKTQAMVRLITVPSSARTADFTSSPSTSLKLT